MEEPQNRFTEFFKGWNKNVLAFVFALIFFFIAIFVFYKMGYNNGVSNGRLNAHQIKSFMKDARNSDSIRNAGMELKIAVQEEKIASINGRFNDLYLFGGMILALLGVILVSVYIKSENDVAKHMQKNFVVHKEEIQNEVLIAKGLIQEIRTEWTAAREFNRDNSSNQENTPEQDVSNE